MRSKIHLKAHTDLQMHDLCDRGQLGPALQRVLANRVDAQELQVGRLVCLDRSCPVCPELRQGSHLHTRQTCKTSSKCSAQVVPTAPRLLLGSLPNDLLMRTDVLSRCSFNGCWYLSGRSSAGLQPCFEDASSTGFPRCPCTRSPCGAQITGAVLQCVCCTVTESTCQENRQRCRAPLTLKATFAEV